MTPLKSKEAYPLIFLLIKHHCATKPEPRRWPLGILHLALIWPSWICHVLLVSGIKKNHIRCIKNPTKYYSSLLSWSPFNVHCIEKFSQLADKRPHFRPIFCLCLLGYTSTYVKEAMQLADIIKMNFLRDAKMLVKDNNDISFILFIVLSLGWWTFLFSLIGSIPFSKMSMHLSIFGLENSNELLRKADF